MKKTNRAIMISLAGILPGLVHAQNVNRPYSVYGLGEIDNRPYNKTIGMAGTGIAIPSSVYFIDNNPAGIAGLQRSFYMMNISATGKLMHYTGTGTDATNSSNKDLWIKGISVAAKINGWWASSIGFGQYSNVNYKFSGQKQVEGSPATYTAAYEGDGGLNEYYWTNAASLGKHFSIGIKASLISGSINQTETITDPSQTDNIVSTQQDYYNHLHVEFGGQYLATLNKHWDLSLGGTFSPSSNLPASRTLDVTDNTSSILTDQYIQSSQSAIPRSFGAGIAVMHDKKTTYAADYTFQNWSALNSKGNGWQLVNSERVSTGLETSHIIRKRDQTFERRFFQAGAFFDHSYLTVHDQPINGFGFSLGTGGNLSNFFYHVALEAGQRGTTRLGLIKETYLQLSLVFSYRDFLFSKGRKYN